MRDELTADAQTYGDKRRSQLIQSAPAAQAIDETRIAAHTGTDDSDPVAKSGWVGLE